MVAVVVGTVCEHAAEYAAEHVAVALDNKARIMLVVGRLGVFKL